MKMVERLFYFVLISIQTFLIIFLSINGRRTTTEPERAKPEPIKNNYVKRSFPRLNSFELTLQDGGKSFMQFASYSDSIRVFVRVSSSCPHCIPFLNHFLIDLKKYPLDQLSELYMLSSESIDAEVLDQHKVSAALASEEDLVQFGHEYPAVYLVNGRGEILFQQVGYTKDLAQKLQTEILKVVEQL